MLFKVPLCYALIPQHKANYAHCFYTYYALTLQYCAGQYTSQTCFHYCL